MWELDHKGSWALKTLLEKTPESPLDRKEITQSILKEVSPEYSLEGLMLKLKLQPFGYLMGRTDSGKDPDAGKVWRQEEKGTKEDDMVGWTWVWTSSRSWWWRGKPVMLQSMGLQRFGHDWATELNWTEFQRGYWLLDLKQFFFLIKLMLLAIKWSFKVLLYKIHQKRHSFKSLL